MILAQITNTECKNAMLAHWGRVTHICVSKLTIIGWDNGLSPGRRQAIISTNARILLIGPLGTNFNETSIEIHAFPFKKIHLKMSSGKWRPFYLGLNVLSDALYYVMPPYPICNTTRICDILWSLLYSLSQLTHFVLVAPYESWLTLVQLMAWCLKAPSHYLN